MFQFTLPYPEAVKIAKKLAHSAGREETRYYLKGFFMHKADDGRHFAVSTDGHMLTRIEVNPSYGEPKDESAVMSMPTSQEPFPAVIFPTVATKQIEGFKVASGERDKAEVLFSIDGLRYELECLGQVAGGKLIDGNYPDYARIIPADWESYTNEYSACGFNPVYLAAIFKAASYSVRDFKASISPVRMFFSAGSPAVIQEAKDPGVLYVIMPMRASFKEHRHAAPETASEQESATAA